MAAASISSTRQIQVTRQQMAHFFCRCVWWVMVVRTISVSIELYVHMTYLSVAPADSNCPSDLLLALVDKYTCMFYISFNVVDKFALHSAQIKHSLSHKSWPI